VKILLDTHAFLWFISGDDALSSKGRALIEDEANTKFVSIVSIWEIAIKSSLGKLALAKPFHQIIPEQMQLNGFEMLELNMEHTIKLMQLPFHHRDPFDRMLVAQCLTEQLNCVSNDSELIAYGITKLW
jgi:PIN domain nuclease of toxin-antitoxin system